MDENVCMFRAVCMHLSAYAVFNYWNVCVWHLKMCCLVYFEHMLIFRVHMYLHDDAIAESYPAK